MALSNRDNGPTADALVRGLMVCSFVLPAMLFCIGAWYDYVELYKFAEYRGTHTVAVLREHAQKVFEAERLVVELADQRVSGMTWNEIRQSRAVWDDLQTLKNSVEEVDAIFMSDATGLTAFATRVFPAPQIDFRPRLFSGAKGTTGRSICWTALYRKN